MLSVQALATVFAMCAIIVLIGLAVVWFIKWIGTPSPLDKYLTIITWIVVWLAVLLRLLPIMGLA